MCARASARVGKSLFDRKLHGTPIFFEKMPESIANLQSISPTHPILPKIHDVLYISTSIDSCLQHGKVSKLHTTHGSTIHTRQGATCLAPPLPPPSFSFSSSCLFLQNFPLLTRYAPHACPLSTHLPAPWRDPGHRTCSMSPYSSTSTQTNPSAGAPRHPQACRRAVEG